MAESYAADTSCDIMQHPGTAFLCLWRQAPSLRGRRRSSIDIQMSRWSRKPIIITLNVHPRDTPRRGIRQ
jgi:hypothetical protein